MKNVQKNKLAGVVIEIQWCVQYFFFQHKSMNYSSYTH